MKISNKLPQFSGEVALIITADKKEAQYYIATDGYITSVRTINVSPPKYTDREGFFESRGKGGVFSSGAVYEKRKEKLEHELLPQFTEAARSIFGEYRITELYLFAPAFLINDLRHALPKNVSKKLRLAVGRNYFGRHPFKLLEKIMAETQKPKAQPEKPEAIKILNRRKPKPGR
jgi:hypothetical protein